MWRWMHSIQKYKSIQLNKFLQNMVWLALLFALFPCFAWLTLILIGLMLPCAGQVHECNRLTWGVCLVEESSKEWHFGLSMVTSSRLDPVGGSNDTTSRSFLYCLLIWYNILYTDESLHVSYLWLTVWRCACTFSLKIAGDAELCAGHPF